MPQSLRRRLQMGTPAMGCWIQVNSPTVAEVFDSCGFDWLAVDCEHTDIGLNQLAGILRGIRTATPLVRVKSNDPMSIRQPLDCGAMGVIVPMVNSAAEAKAAVASAHYPPNGIRGFAYCRANDYGARFDQYVARAGEQTVVLVMIESVSAINEIDSILNVEGVDGVIVGPYDLTGSMGIPGQTDHPLVADAMRSVVNACELAGKAAGLHIVEPDVTTVSTALEIGYRIVAIGMDTVFLAQGARKSLALVKETSVGTAPREIEQ